MTYSKSEWSAATGVRRESFAAAAGVQCPICSADLSWIAVVEVHMNAPAHWTFSCGCALSYQPCCNVLIELQVSEGAAGTEPGDASETVTAMTLRPKTAQEAADPIIMYVVHESDPADDVAHA